VTGGPQVSIEGQDEEIVVARVIGEIDLASAEAVGGELAGAVPNLALGLIVDLSGTSYLDSSGVSLVFELAERLRRRQQQLRLVVPPAAPLRRVLRIVDAGGVVPIVETVEEAALQIHAAT
jgi:anti-anti-sigma factor